MKANTKKLVAAVFGCSLAMLGSSVAVAGSVTIPNTFTSGTPAVAGDVNDNFTAVKTAVDDNDARVTELETALAALQAKMEAMDAGVTLDDLVGSTYCGISHWSILGTGDNNFARIGHGEGEMTATFVSATELQLTSLTDQEVELGWWVGTGSVMGTDPTTGDPVSYDTPIIDAKLETFSNPSEAMTATISGFSNGILSIDIGGETLSLYVSKHGDTMIHTDGAADDAGTGYVQKEMSGSIWVRCQ